MDNPFGAYFSSSAERSPTKRRPQGKRRRRRRREAEPQTIGTNPETWPPPDPEPFDNQDRPQPPQAPPVYHDPDAGFTGDWNDWTSTDGTAVTEPTPRAEDVDWNDWATSTATEQSGELTPPPTLPRLKDYGGGGPITRRPRKSYRDERYDDPGSRAKTAAVVKGVVGALAFVVLLGVAANIFLGPSEEPVTAQQALVPATRPGTPTTVPPLPEHALSGCEAFRSESITISAERGDTATPQGAILGFEYSYYVERDAAKARTYVTDDAHVGDEAALAAGIATFPLGVKYCIHITRGDSADPSVWHVTVHQQWPGESAVEKIHQTMRTAEVVDGRFRITRIEHR